MYNSDVIVLPTFRDEKNSVEAHLSMSLWICLRRDLAFAGPAILYLHCCRNVQWNIVYRVQAISCGALETDIINEEVAQGAALQDDGEFHGN
jgi:hypothetical protein